MNIKRLQKYFVQMTKIERMTPFYIVNAFHQLGWNSKVDKVIDIASLLNKLAIKPLYSGLITRFLSILEEEGLVRRDADQWVICDTLNLENPPETFDLTGLEQADQEEIQLFVEIAESLPVILTGEVNPLEILFAKGSIEKLRNIYSNAALPYIMNHETTNIVSSFITKNYFPDKPLRILEIGAGTGSVTRQILPMLKQDIQYFFTDVTNYFLIQAKKMFQTNSDLHYQRFDINFAHQEQGFESASFNIIIAANVIHASKNLTFSLNNILKLLKANGKLVFLECAPNIRKIDIIFGVTEGWWGFEDNHIRQSGPLINTSDWVDLLRSVGYKNIELPKKQMMDDENNAAFQWLLDQQHVFIAEKS